MGEAKLRQAAGTYPEPTPKPEPVGVTSIMVPLATETRRLLTECHRELLKRDPSTVPTDALFASAVITSVLISMHAGLFPKTIIEPHILPPDAPLTAASAADAARVRWRAGL